MGGRRAFELALGNVNLESYQVTLPGVADAVYFGHLQLVPMPDADLKWSILLKGRELFATVIS